MAIELRCRGETKTLAQLLNCTYGWYSCASAYPKQHCGSCVAPHPLLVGQKISSKPCLLEMLPFSAFLPELVGFQRDSEEEKCF